MASYDVAMWLRSENVWPEMVLVVQAETAGDAVKVAANAGDGHIHRWYGVTTLVDGFDYQCATCLLMGWPDEQQALVPRGGESVHTS